LWYYSGSKIKASLDKLALWVAWMSAREVTRENYAQIHRTTIAAHDIDDAYGFNHRFHRHRDRTRQRGAKDPGGIRHA
jgi:hypothetical protein